MSTPTQQTIDYWLDWFGFLADDRLSLPQAEEAKRVLELARVAPELLTALKMARTELGNMSISGGSANWDDVWTTVNVTIAKAEAQP